jgi:sugar phosphate isomerase/epimerase
MLGREMMTRPFSIAHLTALNCTPAEIIHIASRVGYDFVSLRPIYMGLPGEPNYDLANNKQMMRDTKAALADTGLRLLDIELARIFDGMDPLNYLPAFEVAAELGGRHVLSSIWTNNRNYAIEKFGEVCDLAKQFDLTVELEFVPIASVRTLADTLDILHSANRSNAGIMIDTHHFHRSGDQLVDLQKIPSSYFRYFHLCDAPSQAPTSVDEMKRILREERLYVGEGGIDIAGIVNSIPVNTPCSIEMPNIKRVKELGYEEYARRCLETAKEFLSIHATEEKSLRKKIGL